MKPPPPMLPALGCTTAKAKAVATAASTAVPPAAITSAPMRDAISFDEETIPFWERVGTELAPVETVSAIATRTARSARAFDMRRIIASPGGGGYTRFSFQRPRRNSQALTIDITENAIAIAQKMPGGP